MTSKWYVSVLENILRLNERYAWMLISILPQYDNIISSEHHFLTPHTPPYAFTQDIESIGGLLASAGSYSHISQCSHSFKSISFIER